MGMGLPWSEEGVAAGRRGMTLAHPSEEAVVRVGGLWMRRALLSPVVPSLPLQRAHSVQPPGSQWPVFLPLPCQFLLRSSLSEALSPPCPSPSRHPGLHQAKKARRLHRPKPPWAAHLLILLPPRQTFGLGALAMVSAATLAAPVASRTLALASAAAVLVAVMLLQPSRLAGCSHSEHLGLLLRPDHFPQLAGDPPGVASSALLAGPRPRPLASART
mmetsp:Transcript_20619/g.48091  ORF Transcript_20619/g.48091 Transcript_20619/m.48091 type:complete len:217 (+) Transcript_20619:599-1249(+)